MQRSISLRPNDFRRGLKVQLRVLLALMLREAQTRYDRQKMSYTWALIEPVLNIGMFYIIFMTLTRDVAIGDSLYLFLATGFGTYFGFSGVMDRTDGGYQVEPGTALLSPGQDPRRVPRARHS